MLDTNPPPTNPDVRYEKSDAWIGGVLAFGAALFLIGVMVQATVSWLFNDLKEREDRKYPRLPALAAKERPRLPRDLDKIPPPRLQKAETVDLAKLRAAEEQLLHSYGWVDRKKGVVRIPIDEAMKMLADPGTAAHKSIPIRSLKEGKQ
jgi:hypothetical protein